MVLNCASTYFFEDCSAAVVFATAMITWSEDLRDQVCYKWYSPSPTVAQTVIKKKNNNLKLPVQLRQSFNLSIIWSHVNSHSLSGWTQIKEWWDALCTTDLCNLCCWKTLLCLPSVPAKWIACEHRSEPHRKEEAMISNSLLRKSPQRKEGGLLLAAAHKQLDSESPHMKQFSRRMEQLWRVCLSLFHIIVEKGKWRHWPAQNGAFTLCALHISWVDEDMWWRSLSRLKSICFRCSQPLHCSIPSCVFWVFCFFLYGLYLFSFGGNRVKRPWESFRESFFSGYFSAKLLHSEFERPLCMVESYILVKVVGNTVKVPF